MLHPSVRFLDRDALLTMGNQGQNTHGDWSQAIEGNLFAIQHEKKNQLILVPSGIHRFLKAFSTENTLETVVEAFSIEAKCSPSEIEPTLQKFLHDMMDRGYLIPVEAFNVWQKKIAKALPDGRRQLFVEGEVFEGWQIQKTLSDKRGLSVYIAQNLESGEKRILKTQLVLPFASAKFKEKEKRTFMQEFALLSELQAHPGICRSFETGIVANGLYAWLENIEGTTPRKFLRENTPTLAEKLHLIRQMIELIAHCHNNGILHGDIHLSNFLIQQDGQVRLIDFDLGNHIDLRQGERLHEGGVQEYAAPEKISLNSFDFIGERADLCSEVWQLGICAYTMLHEGKYPFSGVTWKELAQNIRETAPFIDHSLPLPVQQFIKKSLSKNPAERFLNTNEMAVFFGSIIDF